MSHGVELIMETVGHIVIRPSPTHYFWCVFLVSEHHMLHSPSILITRCVSNLIRFERNPNLIRFLDFLDQSYCV